MATFRRGLADLFGALPWIVARAFGRGLGVGELAGEPAAPVIEPDPEEGQS